MSKTCGNCDKLRDENALLKADVVILKSKLYRAEAAGNSNAVEALNEKERVKSLDNKLYRIKRYCDNISGDMWGEIIFYIKKICEEEA